MMKVPAFLATFAIAFTTPALSAPVDPHAGHHPPETVAPRATPAAPAPVPNDASMPHKCPMMDKTAKSMPPDKTSPSKSGPAPMMMCNDSMAPDMIDKVMKATPAPATPAPEPHKHE